VRLFSKTIVKYPKTAATVFLLTLSSLLFAFYWFEPFSPKYQGKTVDDWLTFYALNGVSVSEDVVLAFGTKAIPVLAKVASAPRRVWRMTKFSSRLFEVIDKYALIQSRARRASEWSEILYLNDNTVLAMIIDSKKEELLNTVLVHCPGAELNDYRLQTTNSLLQTIAERTWKARRSSGTLWLHPQSVRKILDRQRQERQNANGRTNL
jgi:hypothetical protein